MLNVKINELPAYIELARKSGNNILVVGDPGVGKSQVINGMAGDKVKVTAFTGSSTYEETINGIPFRDTNGMDTTLQRYTEPQWLRDMVSWAEENPDGMNLLFIDEFNTAEPQVLKTFLSVLTEHKVPTQAKALPSNTVIIAAMNPCNQNNGEELIRPLASRFMVLQVESSIDDYRDYYESIGEEAEVASIKTNEKATKVSVAQVNAILDQIMKEDWCEFKDGSYHEINPRSMSNFIKAMEWVNNPKKECRRLSQAFFGKEYKWEENAEEMQKKREKKVKAMSEFLTLEEIEKMETSALKAYYDSLQKPNLKGSDKLIACRLNCRKVLTSRGEKV